MIMETAETTITFEAVNVNLSEARKDAVAWCEWYAPEKGIDIFVQTSTSSIFGQ